MPTVTTTPPDQGGGGGAWQAGSGVAARLSCLTTLLVLSALGGVAHAESFRLQPTAAFKAVATNNVAFTTADTARSDLILITTPRVDVRLDHPDYQLNGSLAADLVSYVGRTLADRILPNASSDLTAKLIDRWVFVDAGLSAGSSTINPFGVVNDSATTVFNRGTVYQQRLSPYIDHLFSPEQRLQVRTDHNWFQSSDRVGGNINSRSYLAAQQASYDLRPTPLGFTAEAERTLSRSGDTTTADVVFSSARVSPTYAVSPQLELFVSGGRDQARYGTTRTSESLAGVGGRWRPSERDLLDATIERRFFGVGWDVNASHRSPFLVVSGNMARQPSTYVSRLAQLPAGGNVAQLLDALLTTRIPNPIDRAVAVQRLITQQGLPSTLAAATELYSPSAQLQQSASVSMALLGVRHVVTLRVYFQRAEDLLGNDPPPLLSGNLRQRGLSLSLSRRLQPELTANLDFTRSRVVGFGPNLGLTTTDRSYQLGLTQELSLRTSASVSLQRLVLESSSVDDATQTALTFGLLHRF